MELKLTDPTVHKEVVAMVADIGGSTVDEATRRTMAFLLDHSLSREYNFVVRRGKREFRGLKLFEVIYGSLKKNALTNQINRKEAERQCQSGSLVPGTGEETGLRGHMVESKMRPLGE